jgi:hypothetical protein
MQQQHNAMEHASNEHLENVFDTSGNNTAGFSVFGWAENTVGPSGRKKTFYTLTYTQRYM